MMMMMMIFYRTVLIVVALVGGLTIADSKSSKFVAIKSRDGGDICAVDVPTVVEWYTAHGTDVRCGSECLKRTECKAFNYNSLSGKCDQYETTPTNFSVISGCKTFERKWKVITDLLRSKCASNERLQFGD